MITSFSMAKMSSVSLESYSKPRDYNEWIGTIPVPIYKI